MPEIEGPSLGICVGPNSSNTRWVFYNLIKNRLFKYKDNKFKEIIVFTKDNINLETSTVFGQNVFMKGQDFIVKEGNYSIPDVIYVQSELTSDDIQFFENICPGRVFNNHFYNKYEGHTILNHNPNLRGFLPETKLFENENDLYYYLNKYKEVFLKPINGYSGQGIICIRLNTNRTVMAITTNEQRAFPDISSLWQWIISENLISKLIIQQSITSAKWRKKNADIRLNMTKNGNGRWQVSFIICRVARNGHFNSYGNVSIMNLRTFLRNRFPKRNLRRIKTSIFQLGHKICKTFDDANYHMADIGIDLGIDSSGKLWVYEVNHLPHPFFRISNDLSLTMPFDYAYYLTKSEKP